MTLIQSSQPHQRGLDQRLLNLSLRLARITEQLANLEESRIQDRRSALLFDEARNCVGIILQFIDFGANPDFVDSTGTTARKILVFHGKEGILGFQKPSKQAQEKLDKALFEQACKLAQARQEIFDLLEKTRKTIVGRSEHIAQLDETSFKYGWKIQSLIKAGANPDKKKGDIPSARTLLICQGWERVLKPPTMSI